MPSAIQETVKGIKIGSGPIVLDTVPLPTEC